MTRLHHVKKARKDYPESDIKKGDSYYWWKFAYSPKQKSKTRPTRSQLTRSDFLSQIYDLEDRLNSLDPKLEKQDLDTEIVDIGSELENLFAEVEDNLENMPEQLRDSSMSGQLLQERIDSLTEMIDEFENIDIEDDDAIAQYLEINYNGD